MIDLFNWLCRTATNGEVIGMAFLTFLFIYAFYRTYTELTSRINELENLLGLRNAAFNNHLRDYHGVDIGGGDSIVVDK